MKRNLLTMMFALAALLPASLYAQGVKKCLVLYYPQTGATKSVAEELGKKLGADVIRMEVEKPYDGDFGQTIARCQEEMKAGVKPVVKPLGVDLKAYDVVFLGYPIWFGTYAPPVASLIAANDFAGKTLVPFCTFGSGGLDESTEALKKALPKAKVANGYGVRTARVAAAPAEIDYFLKSNGYVAGKVEPLADFSEQKTVTDAEQNIFTEACSSYQFPLGTPKTAGHRAVKGGTEYKYIVDAGRGATSVIYVIALDGAKPDFTKVVR